MKGQLYISVCLLLFLTSCASMLGNGKTIKLETSPVNATVIAYDNKGTLIETVTDPNEITFEKSGNYTLEFNKNNYIPEKIPVKKKFNHSFWLNFLVSGIGYSSTFLTDYMTGHNYESQFENPYVLAGYGLCIVGIIGVFVDIFTGSLVGVTPEQVNVSLRLTPEAIAAQQAEQEAIAKAEAQARAEREAAEEARRLAREEANRYDPANFILVPSDFKPADYRREDLFAAVSASEKLGIVDTWATHYGLLLDMHKPPSIDFVSDVVFVSQDGTNITFRTEDNAIIRRMKIDSRTGLVSGQKVRIYYTAYRIQDWRVIAIERR
jgi:hypothetical protein